jgi:ubiquinone/menaquinone biosynthesis C-methylase UbiE
MFVELFGNKLALAPVDDIPLRNVLDIATGTGIWAIEFGIFSLSKLAKE